MMNHRAFKHIFRIIAFTCIAYVVIRKLNNVQSAIWTYTGIYIHIIPVAISIIFKYNLSRIRFFSRLDYISVLTQSIASYANLNHPPLSSILRFGVLSPAFRYGQFASTSFCAIIGTTLFPIRSTCFAIGYGFQL